MNPVEKGRRRDEFQDPSTALQHLCRMNATSFNRFPESIHTQHSLYFLSLVCVPCSVVDSRPASALVINIPTVVVRVSFRFLVNNLKLQQPVSLICISTIGSELSGSCSLWAHAFLLFAFPLSVWKLVHFRLEPLSRGKDGKGRDGEIWW